MPKPRPLRALPTVAETLRRRGIDPVQKIADVVARMSQAELELLPRGLLEALARALSARNGASNG